MRTLYFFKDRDGYQEYPTPTEDELSEFWVIEVNEDFVYQGQRVDPKTGKLNPVIPDDVLIAQISAEQKRRISYAGTQIAILADVVELSGETTSDEATQLAAWRQYRVDVYNVTKQSTYPQLVSWPAAPV